MLVAIIFLSGLCVALGTAFGFMVRLAIQQEHHIRDAQQYIGALQQEVKDLKALGQPKYAGGIIDPGPAKKACDCWRGCIKCSHIIKAQEEKYAQEHADCDPKDCIPALQRKLSEGPVTSEETDSWHGIPL